MEQEINIFFDFIMELCDAARKPIDSLFAGRERISWLYLGIALLLAWLTYWYQKKKNYTKDRSFSEFLKLKSVYLHPSALLDYQYWLIRTVILTVFILPFVVTISFVFDPMVAFYDGMFGARAPKEPSVLSLVFYTFIVAMAYDFAKYWAHRSLHTFPFLWELHKVHHSAEVLVPFTTKRGHPLEAFVYGSFIAVVLGPISAFYAHYYGGMVGEFTLFGLNAFVAFTHAVSGNLRHTHIWISYGKNVEHFLSSPAQHQIHHSDNPKHFNKNFVGHFAFWDWVFGTLYTTTPEPEKLTFGIGKEGKHYRSIRQLLFRPVVMIFRGIIRKVSNK